ncbi:MAG TPA: hypothetical protein VNU70_06450 [Puia sp.]|jgi:hypothetical protein|nr:hypothetical protein [Puia sp.]
MEQEKEFTSQESLALITKMINKTRRDYLDSGLSALLWGSVITICSLATFVNYKLNWRVLDYIWFLTIAAVVPQIIIAIREGKNRKHRAYEDDLMGGIWISFGISVFLLSYILSVYNVSEQAPLYLMLYGVPTFATGYARRFKPMLIGGVACWVLAIVSHYTPYPYSMLCIAVAAQVAWFIPGLIIRKCYLKAKEQHV